MLAIRVDGNNEIGIGHVQRCISIGECLKELGLEPIFIMADTESKELVVNKGFKFLCLDSKWNDMQGEILKITQVVKKYRIKTILIDSYSVTSNYTEVIGSIVSLYLIDDFYVKYYKNLKGIISYNIGCDFSRKIYNSGTQHILGTAYIPLRKEFQNIVPIQINLGVKNILLTTGGTDKDFIIENFLNIFNREEKFKDTKLHVIVGKFFSNKRKLDVISKGRENIILYHNIDKMADIMLQCDMAISAGGTTLYELCVCGLPTVTFCIADNQINMTNALFEKKVLLYSGDYKSNKNELLNNIVNNTIEVMENKELRQEMQNKAVKILDGNGSMRIAHNLIRYI